MFSTLVSTLEYDPKAKAIVIGLLAGLFSGLLALALVMTEPLILFVGLAGLGVGLLALTDIRFALITAVATTALLPYGTLPFSLGITPSLIDTALGGFLLVYLMQWMTGRRLQFRMVPVLPFFLLLITVMLFAFVMGTAHASPTPGVLRRFVGLLLNITMALILVDVVRTETFLKQIVLVLGITGAVAAAIGTVLWFLPDLTAEGILNRFGRIGYPVGGVLHYREDGVQRGIERAIGTWIDPNAFGGFLMMIGALLAPQVGSCKPITGHRWIAAGLFGVVMIGLFLTNSRGPVLGLLAGTGLVALLRYRQLIWGIIAVVVIAPFAPVTSDFVQRLIAGITGADLETQMRFGEYGDALRLISRYPALGVGFSAPPDIDLYLGVSSTYLIILSNAGILGLLVYLLAVGSTFYYGFQNRQVISQSEELIDIWSGLAAGVFAALFSGIFDHFYFNIEFQAISLIFWFYIGLLLVTTRLAVSPDDREEIGLPAMPEVHRMNQLETG